MKNLKLFPPFILAVALSLGVAGLSPAQTSSHVMILIADCPPVVLPGEPYPVSWIVKTEGELTHADLHWRKLIPGDIPKLFEKMKEEGPGPYCEDEQLLDETLFQKGKKFEERIEEYRDSPIIISEFEHEAPSQILLVVHAIVDGYNYYIFRILHTI